MLLPHHCRSQVDACLAHAPGCCLLLLVLLLLRLLWHLLLLLRLLCLLRLLHLLCLLGITGLSDVSSQKADRSGEIQGRAAQAVHKAGRRRLSRLQGQSHKQAGRSLQQGGARRYVAHELQQQT